MRDDGAHAGLSSATKTSNHAGFRGTTAPKWQSKIAKVLSVLGFPLSKAFQEAWKAGGMGFPRLNRVSRGKTLENPSVSGLSTFQTFPPPYRGVPRLWKAAVHPPGGLARIEDEQVSSSAKDDEDTFLERDRSVRRLASSPSIVKP
jgi:hypothetical protein